MTEAKKAFVLMPFKEPYDSYYSAIFRPALETAGYSVTRADDLFTPHPIMLDVQKAIIEADLIMCEMSGRNPNVFYELGLSHAIGKPAILVSRKEEDIPFDLRHVRVIVYDYKLPGWETKLKESITNAANTVTESSDIWPPPLNPSQNTLAVFRTLANEITFNLASVNEFNRKGYQVRGNSIDSSDKKDVPLDYFTCMTTAFDSTQLQMALSTVDKELSESLFHVYGGFRKINDKADALKHAFRSQRAAQYIDALVYFEDNLRPIAEKLIIEFAKDQKPSTQENPISNINARRDALVATRDKNLSVDHAELPTGTIEVMDWGGHYGKRRIELSKTISLLSSKLRQESASKIINLILHKIRVHTAVFAFPNPSAIIPINDRYFGRFSWDNEVVTCHEIFEIPQDTDVKLWQMWTHMQSEYVEAYSAEHRQPNTAPTNDSFVWTVGKLQRIVDLAERIISETEYFSTNTNKILLDRLKETLNTIDFKNTSHTPMSAVVKLEVALSTSHDLIKRLMPRVIQI